MDGLIRQISELAAPGSRLCFDALHRDYLDGRVKNRGFKCGSEVRAERCLLCLHWEQVAHWPRKALRVKAGPVMPCYAI